MTTAGGILPILVITGVVVSAFLFTPFFDLDGNVGAATGKRAMVTGGGFGFGTVNAIAAAAFPLSF
jgi:hypothetical protein